MLIKKRNLKYKLVATTMVAAMLFSPVNMVHADYEKNVKMQSEVTDEDVVKIETIGLDLDGKVTLKDAKKALAISLGIDKSTDNDNYIGNINGKGITLIEAKTILRMSIGIEKSKAIS